VKIPVETLGTTSPNAVVSDLQSHPETTLVFNTDGELANGVLAALQKAGLNTKILTTGPTPVNLQYLKEGKETAILGEDLPVLVWTVLDLTARQIIGQEPVGPEGEGIAVVQFLTSEDINFDISKGWTGYPDFAERFAKLWGVEG